MSSRVQSVLFDRKYWSGSKARTWLKNHNLTPIKRVHKTEAKLRYRIRNPKQFSGIRTKTVSKHIQLLVGFP